MSEVSAGLTVRPATPADARGIAAVHRESWRTTYAGILPLEVIAREAGRKSERAWGHRLAMPPSSAASFVAERAQAGVVGFVHCGGARSPLEGLEAEIYALYVLQPEQRRGAGRALVREAARHFVRQGLFGFYLWVLKANRARLFYETLGGEVVAEKTESLGGHPFAEVAYAWHDLTALVG